MLQATLVEKAEVEPNHTPIKIALFNPDGTPYKDSGATAALTGYAGVEAGPVAASDTVLSAIAKLEARIEALEAAS